MLLSRRLALASSARACAISCYYRRECVKMGLAHSHAKTAAVKVVPRGTPLSSNNLDHNDEISIVSYNVSLMFE